jgi:hypothetical protein
MSANKAQFVLDRKTTKKVSYVHLRPIIRLKYHLKKTRFVWYNAEASFYKEATFKFLLPYAAILEHISISLKTLQCHSACLISLEEV